MKLHGTKIIEESGLFAESDDSSEKPTTPALAGTEKLEESGFFASAAVATPPGERPPSAAARTSASRQAHRPAAIRGFLLLETIGAGAMGEVYAAYDNQLDRKVAIKLVHGSARESHTAKKRLLREAQTLAQVSHPNIVQIHEAGEFEGRVFLVMEYIRGVTLSKWLATREDLPKRTRKRDIVRQFIAAGRGLQAAHDARKVSNRPTCWTYVCLAWIAGVMPWTMR